MYLSLVINRKEVCYFCNPFHFYRIHKSFHILHSLQVFIRDFCVFWGLVSNIWYLSPGLVKMEKGGLRVGFLKGV
ncbi:hypothetical protein HanIR_Chr05g0240511 [Helianthus annuus]|nr:hypothetical protein HanIR_Chr05g0240511 [Helianthus annuus]